MRSIFCLFICALNFSFAQSIEIPEGIVHRHERAQALPALSVGIVIYSDSHQDNEDFLRELVKSYGLRVKEVVAVSKRKPKTYRNIMKRMSSQYDVILSVGGTGYTSTDLALEMTEWLIDKRIPGYEAGYHRKATEMETKSSVSGRTLGMLTRTTAFLTQEGCIVLLAPGSPHATNMAMEVIGQSLKILHYQRVHKVKEKKKF